MVVTLEEMKQYLRVDYEDDDQLITGFIASAEQLCRDILRVDETADLEKDETVKVAVMYAAAYFYEHREEADHHDLALTIRIFISKNTVVTDAIGNHRNEWKPFYTCYATVSGEAGKEQTDAGMVVDDSNIDFTIRWCKKAAEIDSTHFRVEFNGELYNIAAVDHMNYRRKSIKLSCEKVRR